MQIQNYIIKKYGPVDYIDYKNLTSAWNVNND